MMSSPQKPRESQTPSIQDGFTGPPFDDPNEPLYLLSLDGGGVRGISEAVILHEVMVRIQKKTGQKELPRPCDYFHLIGGTSTGGLIAIMLGRLRMTTQQVIDEYETISKQIFSLRNRRADLSFGHKKLERCVQSISQAHIEKNPQAINIPPGVAARGKLKRRIKSLGAKKDKRVTKKAAPMVCPDAGSKTALSFVVSLRKGADDNTMTLFRSYMGKGEATSCEIWEAARATTAAPRYFAPARVTHGGKKGWFIDGAVKCNNPAKVVLSEAESHFGPHRILGCLVSLGSGLRPPSMEDKGKGDRLFSKSYSIFEMLRMAADMLTDPEGTHRDIEGRLKGQLDSYFRFSVPYTEGEERIRIHQYKRMEGLRLATEEYLKQRSVSDQLDELVAVLTDKKASDLTLQAASRANSAETATGQVTHALQHRKTTSPVFTGREDILDVLDRVFSSRTHGSRPRRDFWLFGAGGIGKTQIALKFVDLYRDRFSRVFWVDASMAYNSYQAIADQVLKHPPKGPALVAAVIEWLESTKEEWLLVIDNHDEGDFTPWLPGYGKGNVLFTSRRNDLLPRPPKCGIYNVTEMNLSDSTTLLLRAAHLDEYSEFLGAQAQPIVEELGSLPLALDHAGAYIKERRCSLEQYLTVLRQEVEILRKAPSGRTAQELTVHATFELSMKRLRLYAAGAPEESEKAVAYQSALQFLHAFCFYHHNNISLEIVARAMLNMSMENRLDDIWEFPADDDADNVSVQSSESVAAGEEAFESRDAAENFVLGINPSSRSLDTEYMVGGLKLLLRFSLLKQVSLEEAVYSIHPLVHSWLRNRMGHDRYEAEFRIARTVLFHAYHPDIHDQNAERFYSCLLPHMKANNSYLPEGSAAKVPALQEMEISFKYAMILKRSCLWEEAIPVLQQVVGGLSHEFDLNDARRLANMVELGKAYVAVNRIEDAVAVFQDVIERAALCEDIKSARRLIVKVQSELSMVFLAHGEYRTAREVAEFVFEAATDFKLTTRTYQLRLSLVYQYLSRWEEAEKHAAVVLEGMMGRRQRGPDHHKTLRVVAGLACIRARLGWVDEAERDLARVAEKFEEDLGPRNLDTLAANSDLAWVYLLKGGGKLQAAVALQRETLEAGRSALGDAHLYTLLMILRLGLMLSEMEEYHEATILLEECIKGRSSVLGEKHAAVIGTKAALHLVADQKRGGELFEKMGYGREDIEDLLSARAYAEHSYLPIGTQA